VVKHPGAATVFTDGFLPALVLPRYWEFPNGLGEEECSGVGRKKIQDRPAANPGGPGKIGGSWGRKLREAGKNHAELSNA